MEEDRDHIRLLILDSKRVANELFDGVLKEFDKLKTQPISRRKYHTLNVMRMYHRNIFKVIAKFKVASNYTLGMANAFYKHIKLRETKSEQLNSIYNNLKNKSLNKFEQASNE